MQTGQAASLTQVRLYSTAKKNKKNKKKKKKQKNKKTKKKKKQQQKKKYFEFMSTVEPQWLEHLWDHRILFETWKFEPQRVNHSTSLGSK